MREAPFPSGLLSYEILSYLLNVLRSSEKCFVMNIMLLITFRTLFSCMLFKRIILTMDV